MTRAALLAALALWGLVCGHSAVGYVWNQSDNGPEYTQGRDGRAQDDPDYSGHRVEIVSSWPEPSEDEASSSSDQPETANYARPPKRPTSVNRNQQAPITESPIVARFVDKLQRSLERSTQFTSRADYHACLMPSGSKGCCTPVRLCVLPVFLESLDVFLKYTCAIDNDHIGVCCPTEFVPNTNIPRRPDGTFVIATVLSPTPPRPTKNTTSGSRPGRPVVRDEPEYPNRGGGDHDHNKPACGQTGLRPAFAHEKEPDEAGAARAAGTATELKAANITIRLGAHNIQEQSENVRDIEVSRIREHPGFQKDTFMNDIAVLRLKRPVKFDEYIRPVCLPERDDESYFGKNAVATGWGTQTFGGPYSEVLREVKLVVWNNTECDNRFAQPITEVFLCAGPKKREGDACQGDSGGPLMVQSRSKQWTLVGVISWGIKCGEPGVPGIYTRIPHFLDFIYEHAVTANEIRRVVFQVLFLKATQSTDKQAGSEGRPLPDVNSFEQPQLSSDVVTVLAVHWLS
ncbi:hypothetical protein HPB50_027245 [Hyalomma asiaticum]|uniref:Uncharacterized protein n=1 Tax=Hyalomma asiaticum TaxID=266040 RepID=A0ACB7SD43_HYAAI|nr:hypothetical protein HPB50_027245 [Hyalomma asiaticum]